MRSRTSIGKVRLSSLVREARAGLVPASDHIADEKRARIRGAIRTVRAAKAQVRMGRHPSEDLFIVEVLACIRRYCDWKGLAFDKLDQAAQMQYLDDADLDRAAT